MKQFFAITFGLGSKFKHKKTYKVESLTEDQAIECVTGWYAGDLDDKIGKHHPDRLKTRIHIDLKFLKKKPKNLDVTV